MADSACFQLPVNGSNHAIHITTVHLNWAVVNSALCAEIFFSNSIYYGIGQEVARGVYFATVNMGHSIVERYTCLVYGNPAFDKNTLISSLKKADRDGKQYLKVIDSPLIISVDTVIEALAQFAEEYRAMNTHVVEVSDNFKERLREMETERWLRNAQKSFEWTGEKIENVIHQEADADEPWGCRIA